MNVSVQFSFSPEKSSLGLCTFVGTPFIKSLLTELWTIRWFCVSDYQIWSWNQWIPRRMNSGHHLSLGWFSNWILTWRSLSLWLLFLTSVWLSLWKVLLLLVYHGVSIVKRGHMLSSARSVWCWFSRSVLVVSVTCWPSACCRLARLFQPTIGYNLSRTAHTCRNVNRTTCRD